eukprot:2838244-Alexandrium_andersonii.AAC.1
MEAPGNCLKVAECCWKHLAVVFALSWACANTQGLRGLRIGGLQSGLCGVANSRLHVPSIPVFVVRFGICAERRCRARSSGASWTDSEAVLGAAQFLASNASRDCACSVGRIAE